MFEATKTSLNKLHNKSNSNSDSLMITQLEILNKKSVTHIVILNRQWSKSNQFSFHIVSMMFRFVMFLVLRFIIVVNLTIDTSKAAFVHIIILDKEFNSWFKTHIINFFISFTIDLSFWSMSWNLILLIYQIYDKILHLCTCTSSSCQLRSFTTDLSPQRMPERTRWMQRWMPNFDGKMHILMYSQQSWLSWAMHAS